MTREAFRQLSGVAPLVTVIIPAFNAERTLSATVESVLAQTHRALQVLIVDDGSSDDTARLATRLTKDDPRITLLSKGNGGVARARNHGLARANGQYTAWLDADDLWHPTKIARQIDILHSSAEPLSFVYTGYRQIDSNDCILEHHRPLTEVNGYSLCRQIATNFFSNVSSIMAPTALAQQIGGYDPCLRDMGIEGAEDFLFQLKLSMRGPAGCCNEALVGYRMHDRNMSLNFARAAMSNVKAVDLVQEDSEGVPDWVFRLGRARVVGFVPFVLRSGDIAGAWRLLATLMRGQPTETLAMTARLFVYVLRDAVRGSVHRDPEIGKSFADADPKTIPWQDHILLNKGQRQKLDVFDRLLAQAQRSAEYDDLRKAPSTL